MSFLLVVVLVIALAVSITFNWWQASEIERQTHGAHTDSRPRGALPPARPGTRLLTPAEAAEHAGAMHEINKPYLPVPSGQHAQAWPCLTARTVPVTATDDAPPWDIPTSSFPVVDQAVQEEHAAFVRSQLPLHEEDVTREDMELALALLRERTAVDLPPAPEYGQACVADVLAAEQDERVAS
jgi:hypothetical protein